jgi:hypothetical protein
MVSPLPSPSSSPLPSPSSSSSSIPLPSTLQHSGSAAQLAVPHSQPLSHSTPSAGSSSSSSSNLAPSYNKSNSTSNLSASGGTKHRSTPPLPAVPSAQVVGNFKANCGNRPATLNADPLVNFHFNTSRSSLRKAKTLSMGWINQQQSRGEVPDAAKVRKFIFYLYLLMSFSYYFQTDVFNC